MIIYDILVYIKKYWGRLTWEEKLVKYYVSFCVA